MLTKKIFATLLVVLFLFSNICVLGTDAQYVWSPSIETSTKITDTSTVDTKGNFLNLESPSGLLIEQNSGMVLYNHNMNEKLRPASVTKVMSILLIMEALDSGRIHLDDKVPCSQNAANMGGSQIWLDTKEELTVDEMLKAICVVSANDCTVAMAEFLAGSEDLFVEQMNKRATELGMKNTTFKNSHGIDEDGHLTTAYDIALMSRELLKNHPDIKKYTTIWMDTLRDGKSELVNTNKLIRNFSGATGLKTGSTSLALYNLSASATRNDLSLIAVILKSPSSSIRFDEAKKLLDYGFNSYEYKKFGNMGDVVESVTVGKGIEPMVNLVFETNAGYLIEKGQEKNIIQDIQIEHSLSAPLQLGQKVGEIKFSLNGSELSKVNIVTQKEVKKISGLNMIVHVYSSWFMLCR